MIRAGRLHLEEGFTQNTVCTEREVGQTCLCRWIKLYRAFGEVGLQPAPAIVARSAKLPATIQEQMLALKAGAACLRRQAHPAVVARWFFCLSARKRRTLGPALPEPDPPSRRALTTPQKSVSATSNSGWCNCSSIG